MVRAILPYRPGLARLLLPVSSHGLNKDAPLKISKLHSRLDIRMYCFTQRIVNDWNILPRSAVISASVNNLRVILKRICEIGQRIS